MGSHNAENQFSSLLPVDASDAVRYHKRGPNSNQMLFQVYPLIFHGHVVKIVK
jgi:hypothetical protein